ncbi:MAG: hypothetical protein MUF23_00080 [Pirellula sp.]|jgi:hypothetical protein|nr:hypothetical protein [Pirellula sp.]
MQQIFGDAANASNGSTLRTITTAPTVTLNQSFDAMNNRTELKATIAWGHTLFAGGSFQNACNAT